MTAPIRHVSRTLAALTSRLLGLFADRRRCRDCGHDVGIHGRYGCLGAVYDRHGFHAGWCGCKHAEGAVPRGRRRSATKPDVGKAAVDTNAQAADAQPDADAPTAAASPLMDEIREN